MNRFRTELTKLIDEHMQHVLVVLSNTGAIKSFEDYKYHVGGLDKLKWVLEMMNEAEKKAEER